MSQKRHRSREEIIAAEVEREAQREAAEEIGAAAEQDDGEGTAEKPTHSAPAPNASENPAPPTAPAPPAQAIASAQDDDEFTGHPPGVDRPSADAGEAYKLSPPSETPAGGEAAPYQPDWRILLHIPYISPYLNETYCYLVPRDPQTIYAIWEVGEATRRHLREKFGDDFFAKNRLIMRVYQVTGIDFNGFNANAVFEIDDFLADKNDYWIKVAPDNDYVAEIGYRAHGTMYFEKVARSNTVFAPKGRRETSERYAAWASVTVEDPAGELPLPTEHWRFNQYYYWKRRTHHAPEEKGCWALVLHQHLPFVRHPEYDVSLEEQWFCEAVLSVYTQLLHLFWRLERDKIDFRITLSLTPTLLAMMQDPLLKMRAARHIDECIALATKERDNSRDKPWYHTIEQILHRFWCAKTVWDAYEGDLTRGYRDFQNIGKIEIITCPATHMILPLYKHFPEAVRAQIRLACQQYERVFGRRPRGMWLPENAFTPGIDQFLAEEGIRWTLASANSLMEGDTRCFFGTYAPVISPAGVAFFGIDEDTRAQVWSRESGYPGHPNYKEWYRDLGYDASWDYLPPYFKTANVRRNTGIKYFRITRKGCDLGQKDFYNPLWAEGTVHEQAGQFVYYRGAQANYARERMAGRKPCIVSAYDAE
ncbi:MAG: DUF4912 domain-containing protein, partial [Planctomycetota bacterium]|nr:DUF4912 domain-containing protein [Planctomycetota bacterium]